MWDWLKQCQVCGYKVHADKLQRFGVPILIHSIQVRMATKLWKAQHCAFERKFEPVDGTKSFACDTILIAVGLDS